MHAINEILKRHQKEAKIEPVEDYKQHLVDLYNESEGKLDQEDGINCEKCRNKGDIRYLDDRRYEITRNCECMEMRRSVRNMERSGLKNVIKKCTLAAYEANNDWQKNIKQKAIEYIRQTDTKSWWFIGGQSGSGKSHICTAIAREFLLKGHRVKYMLWKEDATKIKASITDKAVYESLLTPYKKTDVLYIDDFFKPVKGMDGRLSPPTQADINLAFELLDYRKSANLRTIISSERYFSELIDIDEATAGRIAEQATKKYITSIKRDKGYNYRLKEWIEV